ncbi:GpU protein [Fusobacterium naviforme]|nr:hypothetical protein F7P78_06660 [Fusobacterium naviforme]PSL09135.1 GpU protein [Fusobacterium naviforme]STO27681.1 Phage protein U [Fusobacterium naviforme]
MKIGCLGNISFVVSDSKIETITGFSRSGSASYAMHQRVNAKELPEFTGVNAGTADLEIMLSSYLGANPFKELRKIKKACERHKKMRLVIGDDYYGQYVIQSYQQTGQHYDRQRGVTVCTATVSLLEYVR